MRRRPTIAGASGLAAALVLSMCAGSPGAAGASSVTIGEVLTGILNVTCASAATLVQKASRPDRSSYTVPFDGVITSFSAVQDATNNTQVRMLIFGPPTGNSFPVLGKTGYRTLLASSVSTFDVRVPVRAGSLLGAGYSGGKCGQGSTSGDDMWLLTGDPDTSATMTGSSAGALRLNIAAVVEPDADHDGYGDVTQDACPESALAVVACPAPDTTITKAPKAKTRKPQVTVEFASSVAHSTFLVSVDGATPREMLSPYQAKLKPGHHTVSVRAVTPFGITDQTPATATFTIKKHKRHH